MWKVAASLSRCLSPGTLKEARLYSRAFCGSVCPLPLDQARVRGEERAFNQKRDPEREFRQSVEVGVGGSMVAAVAVGGLTIRGHIR